MLSLWRRVKCLLWRPVQCPLWRRVRCPLWGRVQCSLWSLGGSACGGVSGAPHGGVSGSPYGGVSGAPYGAWEVTPVEACPVPPMEFCPVPPMKACPVHPMEFCPLPPGFSGQSDGEGELVEATQVGPQHTSRQTWERSFLIIMHHDVPGIRALGGGVRLALADDGDETAVCADQRLHLQPLGIPVGRLHTKRWTPLGYCAAKAREFRRSRTGT